MKRVLRFLELPERHKLSKALLESHAEAAVVRLHAHHISPVDFSVSNNETTEFFEVKWIPPSDIVLRSYANEDDAKRDGAYALALAAVDETENLIGIHRAETKTGADYYVAGPETDPSDLESALRLEVSGTDGDTQYVRYRLKQKKEQARRGKSALPAIAAVVGFRSKLILVEAA